MFLYFFLYPIIIFFSILPNRVLYFISDLFYYLVYYIVKYRRDVVKGNIYRSFPDKTDDEKDLLVKKFYKHFCDVLVEYIMLFTMKKKDIIQKYKFLNIEVFNEYYDKKKSIIAIEGHYANWEWGLVMPLIAKQKVFAVYKPLSNKYFDKMMFKLRSRFGINLMSMKHTFKQMLKNKENISINLFIADQRPMKNDVDFWTKFLNQDTPIITGPEKIARQLDFAVVFLKVNKVKRGFYQVEVVKITDNPKEEKEFYITQRHAEELEKVIIENPEFWLWSHKRWKFNKKDF